jgi:hypothetical protein
MAAAEAAEVAAMVMVFFASIFVGVVVVLVVGGVGCVWARSLTLPESRSSVTYLNRQFRKSKSIITI